MHNINITEEFKVNAGCKGSRTLKVLSSDEGWACTREISYGGGPLASSAGVSQGQRRLPVNDQSC